VVFIIKVLAKTLAALNSNSKPISIAAAVSMAFLLALMPAGSLLWISLVLLSLLFRVHWGMELLFWLIFKGLAPVFYNWTEPFGWALMQKPALGNMIRHIYDIPLMFLSDLNHSLTIGGLTAGLIAWIPLTMLTILMVRLFREKISPAIARSTWMKALQKTPLIGKLTQAIRQFSGLYR